MPIQTKGFQFRYQSDIKPLYFVSYLGQVLERAKENDFVSQP